VTGSIDPLETAVAVAGILDRLGIVHTIGGSIAASFAGEPRSSIDIDFVAVVREDQVSALVEAFSADFYVDEDALRRAVRLKGSANLIEQRTQLKIDLFIAGGTPLDEQQLKRRQPIRLGSGQTVYVHPPEDILLQKLRWYRLGGEQSDRQWRDILGIVRVQGPRLDRGYLEANAPVLEVSDLLLRALDASA
jgi:hypothetical protein